MHLRYDLYGAALAGVNAHAQVIMRELKLTYQHSTPQSIGDQWWFWNVEGDTSNLPEWITELKVDPMKCIGFGLNEEMAIKIRDHKSSNLGSGPVVY